MHGRGEFAVLFARPGPKSTFEDEFELEADAVDHLGIETQVINVDFVVDGEPDYAVDALPDGLGRLLYRGPILRAEEYEGLAEALASKGGYLVVDPAAYEHALYVPEHHAAIADLTAPTRWTYGTDLDEAWEAANGLGPPPWLLKDHVKSAKEDWDTACYVPAGAGRAHFDEVALGLLEHRGERFERGFVIRQFLDLATSSVRTPTRRIPEEHRLFFWEGELVAHAPYHPIVEPLRDIERFREVGRRIDSPFFTADVAFRSSGGWVVVELNDGGVSALPDDLHPLHLYEALLR